MSLLFISFALMAADTRTAQMQPPQLRGVGIVQHLDAQLPLDAVFRDETGQTVTLGSYAAKRPLLLAFVYYNCPRLCSMILRGTLKAAKALPFEAGRDFEMLAISIDPGEDAHLARETKQAYINRYGKRADAEGWHFLTGAKDQISRVTDAAGFQFTYDPATKQFSHASTLLVLTPQGRISRYLFGVEFAPKDVRLALVEASAGKIGSRVDQFLLYCFNYDPATGRYSAAIVRWIRFGAALTIAMLFALIWRAVAPRREARA